VISRTVACAWLGLSLLALTAWSGERHSHGTLKACSIVTSADAKVALGSAVKTPGKQTTIDVFSNCLYSAKTGFKFFQVQVASTAMIQAKHKGRTAAIEYSQAKAGGHTQTVSGLGDKAFWLTSYKELWVLKGDVVSNYYGAPESRDVAAAKRIETRL